MATNLLFSGDFAPLINPSTVIENQFCDLEGIYMEADCHITNLECPLTSVEKPIEKTGPVLKAQPDSIKLLKKARVNVACLANNHIFDYGETGIRETITICTQNDIDTLGIVNRPDASKSWLIKEIKDKKIGFLNYCEHEFSVREKGEFGANGYNPIRCFYEISALRPKVDYLIVIYHGGNEYYPLPRPGLKKAFHYLVDLGADAVIGHHTHVISGFENYKGKPLLYSLGNFFFPYENEPEEWHFGMLCLLTFNEDISFKLIPFVQCKSELKVELLAEQDNILYKRIIDNLSEKIKDDNSIQQEWMKYVRDKSKSYFKQIANYNIFWRVLLKLGFSFDMVMPIKKISAIMQLLKCQSHYELMDSATKTSRK